MGLVNGRIKAPEREREIDGIDVVEEMAPEGDPGQRSRGDQNGAIPCLPEARQTRVGAIDRPTC